MSSIPDNQHFNGDQNFRTFTVLAHMYRLALLFYCFYLQSANQYIVKLSILDDELALTVSWILYPRDSGCLLQSLESLIVIAIQNHFVGWNLSSKISLKASGDDQELLKSQTKLWHRVVCGLVGS